MALYLGNSEKLNINLNDIAYHLKSFSAPGIKGLLSSDNFILQDSTGLYLLAKEDE